MRLATILHLKYYRGNYWSPTEFSKGIVCNNRQQIPFVENRRKSVAMFSTNLPQDSHWIRWFLFTFMLCLDNELVRVIPIFWFGVARLVRILTQNCNALLWLISHITGKSSSLPMPPWKINSGQCRRLCTATCRSCSKDIKSVSSQKGFKNHFNEWLS